MTLDGGDLYRIYGEGGFMALMVVVALCAFGTTVVLVTGQLAAMLKARVKSVSEGGIWIRSNILSQPSKTATEAVIREHHAIPLDPMLTANRRLGLLRRVLFLRFRPGSAKNAFLVQSFHSESHEPERHGISDFRLGGAQLQITPFRTESASHLLHSIQASLLRRAVPLVVLALDDLDDESVQPTCFTVSNWESSLHADDRDVVITYLSDEIYARHGHGTRMDRGEVPPQAIWLLDVSSSQLDETDSGAGCSRGASASSDELAEPAGIPRRSAQRDPMRGPRRYRYLTVLVLWAIALSTLAALSVHAVFERLEDYQVTLLVWIGPLAFTAAGSLMLGHMLFSLLHERRSPRSWTATTTRCYLLGRQLRFGLRSGLSRKQRRRSLPMDASGAECARLAPRAEQ